MNAPPDWTFYSTLSLIVVCGFVGVVSIILALLVAEIAERWKARRVRQKRELIAAQAKRLGGDDIERVRTIEAALWDWEKKYEEQRG